MTFTWVLVLAAGTYALRLAGVLLRERVRMPEWAERLVSIAATTLLVALVATATLTADGGFAGWARPTGVAVGALAAWRRLPFFVVVVLAASTTALLRWAGVP
ncbi:Branched-chain amino acid transport protein (AzlD) [Streptoalloteichus tenebrarius]|uniref:Branched-chain amino acid transport protein (AzlD) n=1 Tax=Streptoalloteichus tenebrarius (strain ATCC 17920 / DSM 40477 / JCM 4838 / CBS 697.72 / NBRC 16177 / NCIMB 11028 / NRRL B-12390 / A12253. 1 / ISP 5477) TaxID=1933 RepID=A0ABT1HS74_STRSD|nr:AzlD domain-containing protein [Streptoalloteichus tenebrarius]MCP2258373.1 Branched-chain amino acid transport protein (AzlD) [Streptoalloteichus tenebrarius]BFF03540.1 hypothetical protein GCM10020241_52150 [Streptoalloteichus tenebrarius]